MAKRTPAPKHRVLSKGTKRRRQPRAVRKRGESVPLLMDHGRTGLKRQRGLVTEEFHPDLKGRKAQKVFTEMLANHALIGGAFWLLEMMVRRVTWSFQPPKEQRTNAKAQELATWFEGARKDTKTPWSMIVSEAFSFAPRGFALLEKSYKLRCGPAQADERFRSKFEDGMWGWRDFSPRSQDSVYEWLFKDGTDDLEGVQQQVEGVSGMFNIPIGKLLHFKLRSSKSNPEGVGLLRAIYRPYYFSTREEELEAIGIDRGLCGFPIAFVPEGTLAQKPTADQAALKSSIWQQLAKLRGDEMQGMMWPGRHDGEGNQTPWDFAIEKISDNVAAADPVIRRWHQLILIGLLCQFLLLGTGDTGSWSLSSDQTGLLASSIGSLLDVISEVFTEEARYLANLNGFDPNLVPEMRHTDVEKQDVQKLVQAMSTAVQSGLLIPGEEAQEYLLNEAAWDIDRTRNQGQPRPEVTPNVRTEADPVEGLEDALPA